MVIPQDILILRQMQVLIEAMANPTLHAAVHQITPHSKTPPTLIDSPSRCLHVIAAVKNDTVSRKLEWPHDWKEVMGSCDGLVLLVNEEEEKFLLNPTTLQQVKLPDPPVALNERESFVMHGFGYDSSTDDYKVVTLSYCFTYNEHAPAWVGTFVDVYCVKYGVWKSVECRSPYYHVVPEFNHGALVNGAIHWLVGSRESGSFRFVIAAFNLADETFNEVLTPKVADMYVSSILLVLGGCLCMIQFRADDHVDVWIMKEYSLVESWTKFRVDADYEGVLLPLYFIGDDDEQVVCITEKESLVVYNRKEGNRREMVVHGFEADEFIGGGTFVESLISPAFSIT